MSSTSYNYECTYTCACIIHILYKQCNLDAIIYNKITSIVNVIRLKLFTLISIVYKYGTVYYNIYTCIYIIIIPDWKRHAYNYGGYIYILMV